jgi:hypothetical protein
MKSLSRRTFSVLAGLLFVFSALLAPQSAGAHLSSGWGHDQPYTDSSYISQTTYMFGNACWCMNSYIRTKTAGQRIGVRRDHNAYNTYVQSNGYWLMLDYAYGGWGYIYKGHTSTPSVNS